MKLLEQARAAQEAARQVADAAFTKMKIEIEKKREEQYKLKTLEEQRKIELDIVRRAKEA